MELKKTSYIEFELDPESKILIQKWLPSTETMQDNEYQNEQQELVQMVKENKAKKLLANTKDFYYTIGPKMQTWTSMNVNNEMYKAGLEKLAFIITPEMFAQISIEQTQDENLDDCFEVKYFDNTDHALKWLKS